MVGHAPELSAWLPCGADKPARLPCVRRLICLARRASPPPCCRLRAATRPRAAVTWDDPRKPKREPTVALPKGWEEVVDDKTGGEQLMPASPSRWRRRGDALVPSHARALSLLLSLWRPAFPLLATRVRRLRARAARACGFAAPRGRTKPLLEEQQQRLLPTPPAP